MWFNYLILTFLYLSTRLPFARFYPVYYDSFEYVRIGQNINWQNFIPLINFSHQPIHTLYLVTILIFKSVLFFIKPEIILISISLFFGLLTLIVWFKLLSEFFAEKNALFATLLLAIFPYFFVINTNIFYESELLFFQVSSFYFLLKAVKKTSTKLLIISGLLYGASLSVFIGSILLLPVFVMALYITNIYYQKNSRDYSSSESRRRVGRVEKFKHVIVLDYARTIMSICIPFLKIVVFFLIAFAFFIALDLFIFRSTQIMINKFISHAFDIVKTDGDLLLLFGRIVRNIITQTGAILSVTGSMFLIFALIKMFFKDKKRFIFYFLTLLPAFFYMQYWHAGLFGRLAIYIILPASLLISEAFQNRLFRFSILVLILLTTINYALHQRTLPPIYQYYSLLEKIKNTNNLAIITSDYNRFLYEKYRENFFTNSYLAQNFIEENLQKNTPVLIDSAGLRFPYYQYDGDFYHVLSTGKVGSSLSLKFLENYQLKLLEADKNNPDINFFVLSPKKNNGKLTTFTNYPSASIISPNQSYSFDPTARLFYLIFDKKDPLFWYYDYQLIY